MGWINILTIVVYFFIFTIIMFLVTYFYIKVKVKKIVEMAMKNPQNFTGNETDEVNWRELYLEKKKERDFYEMLYNKEKNANNSDEKCQRIKELEAKVKALEIELEGVI